MKEIYMKIISCKEAADILDLSPQNLLYKVRNKKVPLKRVSMSNDVPIEFYSEEVIALKKLIDEGKEHRTTITAKDMCELMDLNEQTVRRWIRSGWLPFKPDRSMQPAQYNIQEVKDYMETDAYKERRASFRKSFGKGKYA